MNPGMCYIASMAMVAVLTVLWLDYHHIIMGGYMVVRQYAMSCIG